LATVSSSTTAPPLFVATLYHPTLWKQQPQQQPSQWQRTLSTARSVTDEFEEITNDDDEVANVAAAASTTTTKNETETAPHAFASLSGLHPASLHAVTHKLHLSTMTEIQQKTFMAASSGQDVLGRARTGTGKTLAFLLPSIESALRVGRVPGPHYYHTSDSNRGGVAILILCPTRELAIQIHTQAQILCASHSNSSGSSDDDDNKLGTKKYNMTSQVMYGGTSKLSDIQKFNDTHPYILVATAGRLIDHIQSSRIGGAGGPSNHTSQIIRIHPLLM
jgi:superfamily II DNA/RNA helicase